MFEKLSTVEERYEDISTRLSDPAVISDNEKYRTLMKEYKNLTPIVEKYREYKKARDAHEEAAELLEEGVSPQPAKEAAKSRADNSNASFFMLGSLLEFRNKYSLRLRILYIFFVGLQGKKQRINGYLPENLCEKRV